MSLFDQIAETANPKNLEQSLNNFDTLHAELMEAIAIIRATREYVQGAYECAFPDQIENDYNLERIDNFLNKHS